MAVSIAFAASPAHTHPSIKESTKAPPPFCGGGAKRRPLSGWMCVAGEAADAMETLIYMHETCACMNITRNSCGYDSTVNTVAYFGSSQ